MAVGHSVYPVAADLQAYLAAAGFPASSVSALGTTAAVQAGIAAFERACSRHFLAGKAIDNSDVGTAGEETRYFDPPCNSRRELDLGPYGDLAEAPTSVVRQPSGSDPTTLVENDDYLLLPENAPSLSWPYTSLILKPGWWPGWFSAWDWPPLTRSFRSIQITGKWGFGLTIPDDAWEAMLQSAVLLKQGQYRLQSTGGRTGYTVTGGVAEQFGPGAYTEITKGWMDARDAAVSLYRRCEL